MKAIVPDAYGGPDVLKLEAIDPPTPKQGEVLVRVRASSINRADVYVLHGQAAAIRLVTGPACVSLDSRALHQRSP